MSRMPRPSPASPSLPAGSGPKPDAEIPVVRPGDEETARSTPDDLDAPEYYSKDRKPTVGQPDVSPGGKDE
jgi:hypothetical protein